MTKMLVIGWGDENGDWLRNRLYPRWVKDTIRCGACPRFHLGQRGDRNRLAANAIGEDRSQSPISNPQSPIPNL